MRGHYRTRAPEHIYLIPKREIAGFQRPKTVTFEEHAKLPILTHLAASSGTR